MAIAFVNRANTANITSVTTVASPATSHTTGNLLVAMVFWQVQNFSSIADTAGNTWTQAGSQLTSGNNRIRIYYAWNCVGNASNIVTVTFAAGATYRAITVYQFSGVDASADPLDAAPNGSTGTGTAISSASVTVSAASDVICAFMEADADTVTAGTGYTLVNFNATGDLTKYFADEYHIVTASEAATATCASGNWMIKASSFKVAGGGGGGRIFKLAGEGGGLAGPARGLAG